MPPYRTLVLFLIILYIQFQGLEGRGELTIRLVSFDNDYGLTYDGGCCDNWQARGWGCMQKCDYVMRVVISGLSRANDHVFLFHRPLMYNKNNIIFDDCPWATELSIPFDTWPGQVELSAYFYDYDDHDDTTLLVDWFDTRLRQESISTSFQHMAVIGSRRNYKTRLTFDWAINCAELSNCVRKDVKQILDRLDYRDMKSESVISSAAAASGEQPAKSMSTQHIESSTTGEDITIMTNVSSTVAVSSSSVWGSKKTRYHQTTGPPAHDDIDIRPTSKWISKSPDNMNNDNVSEEGYSPPIKTTASPFRTTVEHPSFHWKSTNNEPVSVETTSVDSKTVHPKSTSISNRHELTVQSKSHQRAGIKKVPQQETTTTRPTQSPTSSPNNADDTGRHFKNPFDSERMNTKETDTLSANPTTVLLNTEMAPLTTEKSISRITDKLPKKKQRMKTTTQISVSTKKMSTIDNLYKRKRPTKKYKNKSRQKQRPKPRQHWHLKKTGLPLPKVEEAQEIPNVNDGNQPMKESAEWHGYHKIPGYVDREVASQKKPNVTGSFKSVTKASDRNKSRGRTATTPSLKVISKSYYNYPFQSASTLSRILTTKGEFDAILPMTAPHEDPNADSPNYSPTGRNTVPPESTFYPSKSTRRLKNTKYPPISSISSSKIPISSETLHSTTMTLVENEPATTKLNTATTPTTTYKVNYREPSKQPAEMITASPTTKENFEEPPHQTEESNAPRTITARVDATNSHDLSREFTDSFNTFYYMSDETDSLSSSEKSEQYFTDHGLPRFQTIENIFSKAKQEPSTTRQPSNNKRTTFRWLRKPSTKKYPLDYLLKDILISTPENRWLRTTKVYGHLTTSSPETISTEDAESLSPWYRPNKNRKSHGASVTSQSPKAKFPSKTTSTTIQPDPDNNRKHMSHVPVGRGTNTELPDLNTPITPPEKGVLSETTNWLQNYLENKDTRNPFHFNNGRKKQLYTTQVPLVPEVKTSYKTWTNQGSGLTTLSVDLSSRSINKNQDSGVRQTTVSPISAVKSDKTPGINFHERLQNLITSSQNARKKKVMNTYVTTTTAHKGPINTPQASTVSPLDVPFEEQRTSVQNKIVGKKTSHLTHTEPTIEVTTSSTEKQKFQIQHQKKSKTPIPPKQSSSLNPHQRHQSTKDNKKTKDNKRRPFPINMDKKVNRDNKKTMFPTTVSTINIQSTLPKKVSRDKETNKVPLFSQRPFTKTGVDDHTLPHFRNSMNIQNGKDNNNGKQLKPSAKQKQRNSTTRNSQGRNTSPKHPNTNKDSQGKGGRTTFDYENDELMTATTTKYTSLDFQDDTVIDAIENWWKQFAPGVVSPTETATTQPLWTRNTWRRFRTKKPQYVPSTHLTFTTLPTTSDSFSETKGVTESFKELEKKSLPNKHLKPTTPINLGRETLTTLPASTKKGVTRIHSTRETFDRQKTKRVNYEVEQHLERPTTTTALFATNTPKSTKTVAPKTTKRYWRIHVNEIPTKPTTRKPFIITKIRSTPTPTNHYSSSTATTTTDKPPFSRTQVDDSQHSKYSSTGKVPLSRVQETATNKLPHAKSWTRNTWNKLKSRRTTPTFSGEHRYVTTETTKPVITTVPRSTTQTPLSDWPLSNEKKEITSTKSILGDLKYVEPREMYEEDKKTTPDPDDLDDYFETSLFPSSKTTYRDRSDVGQNLDLYPAAASNTNPKPEGPFESETTTPDGLITTSDTTTYEIGLGDQIPNVTEASLPDTSTGPKVSVVESTVKDIGLDFLKTTTESESTPSQSKTSELSPSAEVNTTKSVQSKESMVTERKATKITTTTTPQTSETVSSTKQYISNTTISTNVTQQMNTTLPVNESSILISTAEVPNSTKWIDISTQGSILLTTLIALSKTQASKDPTPTVSNTEQKTSETASFPNESSPLPEITTASIPRNITTPPPVGTSTVRPEYSTRDPNSIKVTLSDILILHNDTRGHVNNGGKPDFVLNSNPVKKKRPPIIINAVAAGGAPTTAAPTDPPTPPTTPKWREILPDLITLISVKVPVRTTPRAVGRKTISSSKPVSPASPVYQNADHNRRTKSLDFKTVVEKYWPAILGSFIGAVFLTAAILTSVLCKQQRIFLRRSRSRPQLRRSPASETTSSEHPEVTESSSSASLCGDL